TSATIRFLEFEATKSSKLWELTANGGAVTVGYGRIGSDGTSKTREFSDSSAADAYAERLVQRKSE
ncbi:MAG: putative DNA-binding WGR domain protein, partial [Pirellulaceae bacterium]